MTDFLCSIIDAISNFVSSSMPTVSLDSGVMGNISSGFKIMVDFIAQTNFILPLPTFFSIIGIVYSIKLAKFSLFLFNWVVKRLRGG